MISHGPKKSIADYNSPRYSELELINEKTISNTKELSTIKNRLGKIEEKINKLHKQSKTLFHEKG